jgi:hypothetical protein
MQADLALKRSAAVETIAARAARQAALLWLRTMGADFDTGWATLGPSVGAITAKAQTSVAAGASAYLARTARADGITADGATEVLPESFAGVDASGRTVDGLLYGAVTTSKDLIGRGADVRTALQAGQTYLQTMVHTAVFDTGRSADLTASTARRYTHYVRVISGGACSRCAMLAGIASAKTAFARHPRCRCTAAPVTDEGKALTASSRFSSPTAYFESMTAAEQDRIFTRAGAEAIRAGADPVAVVSARRGARGTEYSAANRTVANSGRRLERSIIGRRPDGTPILGYTTGEGTSIRGAFGKQQRDAGVGTHKVGTRYSTVKRIRLMPETIIGLTDDVEMRQLLLRDAGYLDLPTTAAERAAPLGGGYFTRRAELRRADREAADAFYRSHGIVLG